MNILVINPGSTSTKVALYTGEEMLDSRNFSHSNEELAKFPETLDQLDFRYEFVMRFLSDTGRRPIDLDCIMSRGGMPPGACSGATAIDDNLIEALRERAVEPHPASLGPIIAARIANEGGGIPAYIYDPITTNELDPIAKVSGVKGIEHDSLCHVLNARAMAISAAQEIGAPFASLNIIVIHIGGGNSVSLWSEGRLRDVYPTDTTAFSAERCGMIRGDRLLRLSMKHGYETVLGWLHGKGGLVSLLGTNDMRIVDQMIEDGDEYALLCMRAMAYQFSKSIAGLFTTVYGKIDGIVFTGGGARWGRLIGEIKERITFLGAPVYMRPGEHEIKALAEGALRVMRGEEAVHRYSEA